VHIVKLSRDIKQLKRNLVDFEEENTIAQYNISLFTDYKSPNEFVKKFKDL